MEAFVYCWTDHKTNKLYIGSHKGATDDGYVCSSKPMMKEYNIRPNDFTRQIIAEGNILDIRQLEAKILESVNAAVDEQYYNQTNGNGKFICSGHSEKTRQKIAKRHLGSKRSEETKQKMRESRKRQIITDEHRQNMSNSAKRRANSEDGKKHLKSIAHLGSASRSPESYVMSQEQKNLLSESVKNAWASGAYKNRKPKSC